MLLAFGKPVILCRKEMCSISEEDENKDNNIDFIFASIPLKKFKKYP
jgi:hypothetical protein